MICTNDAAVRIKKLPNDTEPEKLLSAHQGLPFAGMRFAFSTTIVP